MFPQRPAGEINDRDAKKCLKKKTPKSRRMGRGEMQLRREREIVLSVENKDIGK